jgi:hypothetical protein
MQVPSFDLLLKNYPNDRNVVALKRKIGGSIDDTNSPPRDQWLGGAHGDTCTIRMSRALNYSGVHIPAKFKGLRTAPGADHLHYAFAVQEMRFFLTTTFGQPNINVKGRPVSRQPFRNDKGIILFDISCFGQNADGTRALGHMDLWDTKTFFDEITGYSYPDRDFFDVADRVSLWIAKGASFWQ